MRYFIYCSLILMLLLSNCAPSRYVKTLKRGEQVASFSFGGPLIKFAGAPIPMPFSTIGYARGLKDNITGFADLHMTSAVFGNIQTDIGATFKLYEKINKFGFSVSPSIQSAYNLRNMTGFRIWPSVDLNGYCHLKDKPSYCYYGISSWFELSQTRAHKEVQSQHVIPDLHLGYVFVKEKWSNQIEVKYLAPGISSLPGVVDYIGISHKGSFGLYYSLIRKF